MSTLSMLMQALGLQGLLGADVPMPPTRPAPLPPRRAEGLLSTEEPISLALSPDSVTQRSLARVETGAGGYDSLFADADVKDSPFKGLKVSEMTIGDLKNFSNPSGQYGKWVKGQLPKSTYAAKKGLTSTPMGKYQIVGSTLKRYADKMKLSDSDVFSPQLQDQMFLQIARDAIATKGKKEKRTPETIRRSMRNTWEGFKKVSNTDLDKIVREITLESPRRRPDTLL
jgi:hypothetical protein